jgi:hypothetical protein
MTAVFLKTAPRDEATTCPVCGADMMCDSMIGRASNANVLGVVPKAKLFTRNICGLQSAISSYRDDETGRFLESDTLGMYATFQTYRDSETGQLIPPPLGCDNGRAVYSAG